MLIKLMLMNFLYLYFKRKILDLKGTPKMRSAVQAVSQILRFQSCKKLGLAVSPLALLVLYDTQEQEYTSY